MNLDKDKIVSSPTQIQKVIAEQGKNLQTVAIFYNKSTDGVKLRETEPYEIRNGKYWGYDIRKDDHIRCFSLDEIKFVCPMPNGFVPRWEVKF